MLSATLKPLASCKQSCAQPTHWANLCNDIITVPWQPGCYSKSQGLHCSSFGISVTLLLAVSCCCFFLLLLFSVTLKEVD